MRGFVMEFAELLSQPTVKKLGYAQQEAFENEENPNKSAVGQSTIQ